NSRMCSEQDYRCWANPINQCPQDLELNHLACRLRGVESVSDQRVLPTFFTEEATALLMTMPNPYWFWRLLRESIPFFATGEVDRIPVEAIQSAMYQLQDRIPVQVDLTRSRRT